MRDCGLARGRQSIDALTLPGCLLLWCSTDGGCAMRKDGNLPWARRSVALIGWGL